MNKRNFLSNFKITYNAPATLTFALISALVLLFDTILHNTLIPAFFTCPGATSEPAFNPSNFLDNRSLAIHPASTIFGGFPEKMRANMDVLDTTIRFSVGLEDVEDLFEDIKQALG